MSNIFIFTEEKIIKNLNFTADTYGHLTRGNSNFAFAVSHALIDYQSGAIFSYIPKNGCSSLRLSLALSNGAIRSITDANWIHKNNDTFQASYKELVTSNYCSVVLRCPYERILSVYLDKIVGRTSLAWALQSKNNRQFSVSDFTFLEFSRTVAKFPNMDHHWRPQNDFLIYEEYDDYFDLKSLGEVASKLANTINFNFIDARDIYKHGTDQVNEWYDTEDAYNISPIELLYQKHLGRLPCKASFFNQEILDIVRKIYNADIELYIEKFGSDNLLFKD